MGMNIPPTTFNAVPAASPTQAQPPVQQQTAVQQGGAQVGQQFSPADIEIFGQMLLGALQELIPLTQGQGPKKKKPNIFDMAKNFNQSGYLRLNPIGQDTQKKKVADDSGYYEAMGFFDE